jgi:hypothetical protein
MTNQQPDGLADLTAAQKKILFSRLAEDLVSRDLDRHIASPAFARWVSGLKSSVVQPFLEIRGQAQALAADTAEAGLRRAAEIAIVGGTIYLTWTGEPEPVVFVEAPTLAGGRVELGWAAGDAEGDGTGEVALDKAGFARVSLSDLAPGRAFGGLRMGVLRATSADGRRVFPVAG